MSAVTDAAAARKLLEQAGDELTRSSVYAGHEGIVTTLAALTHAVLATVEEPHVDRALLVDLDRYLSVQVAVDAGREGWPGGHESPAQHLRRRVRAALGGA